MNRKGADAISSTLIRIGNVVTADELNSFNYSDNELCVLIRHPKGPDQGVGSPLDPRRLLYKNIHNNIKRTAGLTYWHLKRCRSEKSKKILYGGSDICVYDAPWGDSSLATFLLQFHARGSSICLTWIWDG